MAVVGQFDVFPDVIPSEARDLTAFALTLLRKIPRRGSAMARNDNQTDPPLPVMPLAATTVTAQVVGSDGQCFGSSFAAPYNYNLAEKFKDRGN